MIGTHKVTRGCIEFHNSVSYLGHKSTQHFKLFWSAREWLTVAQPQVATSSVRLFVSEGSIHFSSDVSAEFRHLFVIISESIWWRMVQKQSPAQKSKQYSSHRTYLIIYITKFYQTCSISRTARIFILILDVYSEHFYQVFSISFSIIFSLYKHQIMLRLNSWFRLLSILFCSFLVATNGQKYTL